MSLRDTPKQEKKGSRPLTEFKGLNPYFGAAVGDEEFVFRARFLASLGMTVIRIVNRLSARSTFAA